MSASSKSHLFSLIIHALGRDYKKYVEILLRNVTKTAASNLIQGASQSVDGLRGSTVAKVKGEHIGQKKPATQSAGHLLETEISPKRWP